MKDDLVREVPTHVLEDGWGAQVYAFRPGLAKADAERFVREFVEWRDSFKPRLTTDALREAVGARAVSVTLDSGTFLVDATRWTLAVRDGKVRVYSTANDAGASDIRSMLEAMEAIEGLL